jgi:hypothetical protein
MICAITLLFAVALPQAPTSADEAKARTDLVHTATGGQLVVEATEETMKRLRPER